MLRFISAWAFRFVWLFAFTLTWEESVEIGGVSLTRIVGLIALGLGLCAVILSGRIRKPLPAHFIMLGYLFWVAVTYFFSSSPTLSFRDILLHIQLIGVTFLVYEFVRNEREQTSVLQAFVLGSPVPIVSLLIDYVQKQPHHLTPDDMRYAAAGFDPNDLAMYLCFVVCVALYLSVVQKQKIWRWVNICVTPPSLLAIVLTGSRGGLVALLTALLIIPALVLARGNYIRQLLAMIAIAVVSVCALMVVPGSTWDRLSTTGHEIMHGTLTERRTIWRAGADAFTARPLGGYGSGTFPIVVAPEVGRAIVAHNVFLEVLVEQGIVGFLLYAAIFATILVSLKNVPSHDRRFWLILLAVFLVCAMGASLGRKKIVWFVIGLLTSRGASSMATDRVRQSWEAAAQKLVRKSSRGSVGSRERRMVHADERE